VEQSEGTTRWSKSSISSYAPHKTAEC